MGLDMVVPILADTAHLTLSVGGMTISVVAAMVRHAERVETSQKALGEAIGDHIRGSCQDLGDDMKQHVLTVERFVAIAYRSDTLAKIEAADAHGAPAGSPSDTGPFPVVSAGGGNFS
ncbi:hypothetical protein OIE66_40685 [Nonomuraea sp. NBC_01738]|uniref:hypothetical protein n=1 Tax=Nonomuraea sp. NBC_01738 TaxID=2976003 RepID=UPI002E148F21|nr:hypothetical protein OIE66_40685 [Nonomuraea sp. NBC_01738]